MRPSLHVKFVDKAEDALVAAVEVYNKPMFRYREETFALLAINAWELLLKARLLKDGGNDPRVIRVYEPRRTKAGKVSKKQYFKRNRAGSPLTVSLPACVVALDKNSTTRLGPEIKSNLDAFAATGDGNKTSRHAITFARNSFSSLSAVGRMSAGCGGRDNFELFNWPYIP